MLGIVVECFKIYMEGEGAGAGAGAGLRTIAAVTWKCFTRYYILQLEGEHRKETFDNQHTIISYYDGWSRTPSC